MTPKTYSNSVITFASEAITSSTVRTEYLLTITSAAATLYTSTSSITLQPWGGGGGGDEDVIYDGTVSIVTDNPNYATINTTETISDGDVWQITWAGTTYELTAAYSSIMSAYCFGNVDIETGGDDGSGVPFYAYKYRPNILAFGTNATGQVSIKIVKVDSGSTTYQTLYDSTATIIADNPNYLVLNNFFSSASDNIQQNETWRVTFDGVSHTVTSWYDSVQASAYVFGNPGVIEPSADDGSGVTYLIYKRGNTQLAFATSHAAGSITLKIERVINPSS